MKVIILYKNSTLYRVSPTIANRKLDICQLITSLIFGSFRQCLLVSLIAACLYKISSSCAFIQSDQDLSQPNTPCQSQGAQLNSHSNNGQAWCTYVLTLQCSVFFPLFHCVRITSFWGFWGSPQDKEHPRVTHFLKIQEQQQGQWS